VKTDILGVGVDIVTMKEARQRIKGFLAEDKPHQIFTPNPEMIMLAHKDPAFKKILNEAEMVIPDGIGVVLASKLNRHKIRERVPGCDLMEAMFGDIKDTDATVYFLGAAPGVAEAARKQMTKKYPGLKIVGVADGYFDTEKEKLILTELRQKKPDILLVGLSMGKQEKWIHAHKDELPVKVLCGIGGSLNIFSGTVKRAPAFFRKLGLEWFYRLLCQPWRLKRQLILPVFAMRVLVYKILRK